MLSSRRQRGSHFHDILIPAISGLVSQSCSATYPSQEDVIQDSVLQNGKKEAADVREALVAILTLRRGDKLGCRRVGDLEEMVGAGDGAAMQLSGVSLRTFKKDEVEDSWKDTLLLWLQWEIAETCCLEGFKSNLIYTLKCSVTQAAVFISQVKWKNK